MKTFSLCLLGAALLATSGCITTKRTVIVQPEPVPVATTTTTSNGRVVTVLPAGYRTTVVRGTTYYTSGDTYYRTAPGGYVVATRPY